MRNVKLSLMSTNRELLEAFRVTIEENVGGTWREVDSTNTTSDQPGANRDVQIEQNQRLVIEAIGADVEMVYDREQNAAMPRVAFETQPTADEKAKMEEDRQQELRDREFGDAKARRSADRAAEQARDKALDEARQKEAAKAESSTGSSPSISPTKPAASPTITPTSNKGMAAPGPSTGGQSSKDVK